MGILCVSFPALALDRKEYKVYIVSDTLKDKFLELQKGFKDTLNQLLAPSGATAAYTVFDTKTNPDTVPAIIKAIKDGNPDLICVVNSSGVFADTNITLKLADPKYKFISENCVPVQSKIAKTWQKPGGNVTGVGVFIQFSSMIKLAQMINPKAKKLVFWTWDAVGQVNEYFQSEIKDACKETNTELYEFKRVSNAEEQFDYMKAMDAKGPEYFAIEGVSAWVHKDGKPADMAAEESKFVRSSINHLPIYVYEDTTVKGSSPAGTCIVWYDIGAQMGEKALKILNGTNPGDIPWDYPRKYNLMFNLAAAKKIGLQIPQAVLTAAYRVYTDFEGNFLGQKN
jgi:putative ABC transport system substrate-binding protein